MNYQEIIKELQEQEISINDFAFGYIENPLPKIGSWEESEQVGGEGQGDIWYSVKYFPEHKIYIKTTGFYSSQSGTDFDDYDSDCSEVAPKEKTITVYEAN